MKRGNFTFVVSLSWLVVCAALASCKGGGGAKKRVPGGEPASAAFLIKTIEAVRGGVPDETVLFFLAEGVAEVCGKGCECLALAAGNEAGNKADSLFSCPSVCTEDARKKAMAAPPGQRLAALVATCKPDGIGLTADTVTKVGEDWLVAYVTGQYFADAYAAANADDKKAYETAFKDFTVPLAASAGLAGVDVVATTNVDTPGHGRIYVSVDGKGGVYAGRAPSARFTPNGAELVPLLGKPIADMKELNDYVSAQWVRKLDQLGKPLEKTATTDEPPPPPEEPDEDDESGGSGTAMALEEGKMGKKDSVRAEGQYKMKRNADDEQLAREQAIEQARQAGILGAVAKQPGGAFAQITGTGDLSAGFDDRDVYGGLLGGPEHSVLGLASARIDDQILVIADRGAPAKKVIEVMKTLGAHGSLLAVDHKGELAVLPVVFSGGAFDGDAVRGFGDRPIDLVVEISAAEVFVRADPIADTVMIKHAAGGGIDAPGLEATLQQMFKEAVFADRRDIVVSIKDDAKVSQMMPALDVALSAGARTLRLETWYDREAPTGGFGIGGSGPGWGPGGGSSSGRMGGPTGPSVSIGQPASVGDLDKAIIRRYVKRNLPKIQYCYEKQLLVKPSLEGTVQTEFYISPNGAVASANGSGVDPEVATCVAQVIKGIEFPKPKGGGGVQVRYPFTFRQAK